MGIKLIRILHILLLLLIVIFGVTFSASNGLVFKGEPNEYVAESLSSATDDNVTIQFSAILFFPVLVISLCCLFKPMKLFEYLFNNLIYLIQIFMLFAIESGSILYTMIYDHNIVLWVWIISFILIVCLTQFFFLKRIIWQGICL